MDKTKFIIHVASDMKNMNNTYPVGHVGSGIGGVSRYKMIPTSGDWMPVNFLEGWITKAELDANPPPYPTHP